MLCKHPHARYSLVLPSWPCRSPWIPIIWICHSCTLLSTIAFWLYLDCFTTSSWWHSISKFVFASVLGHFSWYDHATAVNYSAESFNRASYRILLTLRRLLLSTFPLFFLFEGTVWPVQDYTVFSGKIWKFPSINLPRYLCFVVNHLKFL